MFSVCKCVSFGGAPLESHLFPPGTRRHTCLWISVHLAKWHLVFIRCPSRCATVRIGCFLGGVPLHLTAGFFGAATATVSYHSCACRRSSIPARKTSCRLPGPVCPCVYPPLCAGLHRMWASVHMAVARIVLRRPWAGVLPSSSLFTSCVRLARPSYSSKLGCLVLQQVLTFFHVCQCQGALCPRHVFGVWTVVSRAWVSFIRFVSACPSSASCVNSHADHAEVSGCLVLFAPNSLLRLWPSPSTCMCHHCG